MGVSVGVESGLKGITSFQMVQILEVGRQVIYEATWRVIVFVGFSFIYTSPNCVTVPIVPIL